MLSLGEYIRKLREDVNMPQRILAYELDIDVSVLSKIENENRFPKKRVDEIINSVSNVFEEDVNSLRKMYLSDEIAMLLEDEDDFQDVLDQTVDKVKYLRNKKLIQAEIDFSDEGN